MKMLSLMVPFFLAISWGPMWLGVALIIVLTMLTFSFMCTMFGGYKCFLGINLIVLSFLIIGAMNMSLYTALKEKKMKVYYQNVLLMMLFFLTMFFSSYFGISFYIYFEGGMLPIFLLIMGWGMNLERLQAGLFMFFYTFSFSLPFLMYIVLIDHSIGNLFLSTQLFWKEQSSFLKSMMISMVFLVKLPMFMVHLWLPKAHVEAPVSGSMILAGVLLKMGGYGLILFLTHYYCIFTSSKYVFMSYGLIGALIISFVCLRQVDIKCLIAYSSVAHMGLVVYVLFFNSNWGLWGSGAMMLAHGLCSSGLFFGLNLFYERTFSRSVSIISGGMFFMPVFMLWWFTLCMGSMSSPPSLNFFSEVFILLNIFQQLNSNFLLFISLMVLSGIYSVYLYVALGHGQLKSKKYGVAPPVRDNLVFSVHVLPMYILLVSGVKMFF